jgi:hypothetical protein
MNISYVALNSENKNPNINKNVYDLTEQVLIVSIILFIYYYRILRMRYQLRLIIKN